ncbi:Uncharacterised protein [Mycobacterium tuberculosis]|nr:Uncharacterised protein [Mycobacterium tuberculosis]CNV53962.1 Uncharacterised protein [Mycobacterium tuberculosis]COZ55047.1 Uncharacterised protein [Mycobacterium tuberculosis]
MVDIGDPVAFDVFLPAGPDSNRDARNRIGLHARVDFCIEFVERCTRVCAVDSFNHCSGDFVRQSI